MLAGNHVQPRSLHHFAIRLLDASPGVGVATELQPVLGAEDHRVSLR